MLLTRRQMLARSPCAALLASTLSQSGAAERTRPTRMHLDSVTYNIAKDWDSPTIIKYFEATGFEGVELRSTHARGVEVTLSKEKRAEVKKRFAGSKVELMGLGSVFEFQMPDQTQLRRMIEG